MKNIMKKYIAGSSLILTATIITLFTQCSQPEYPTPAPSTTFQTTNVLFINALPDDSLVDFLVDNVTLQASIATGTNAGSPYLPIQLGPRVIGATFSAATSRSVGQGGGQAASSVPFPFRTASSSTSLTLSASNSTLTGAALTAAGAALEVTNAYIIPDGHFTVIAQGATGKRSKLLLVDNMSTPASGKAKVRLVNAYSGVVNALLDTTGGTAPVGTVTTATGTWSNVIIKDKAYNASASSAQGFTAIDPTINLTVFNAPAVSTVSGFVTTASGITPALPSGTFQAGGIYTIVVIKKNGAITNTVIRHDQ